MSVIPALSDFVSLAVCTEIKQYGKLVEEILQKHAQSGGRLAESEVLADLDLLSDAEDRLTTLTRTLKERYEVALMSFFFFCLINTMGTMGQIIYNHNDDEFVERYAACDVGATPSESDIVATQERLSRQTVLYAAMDIFITKAAFAVLSRLARTGDTWKDICQKAERARLLKGSSLFMGETDAMRQHLLALERHASWSFFGQTVVNTYFVIQSMVSFVSVVGVTTLPILLQ